MAELAAQFGRLVAIHRRRRGWTQGGLAERAGISVDMVAKLETGATGARFPTIEKLAHALGVESAELFHSEIPRGTLLKGKRREIMSRLEELPDTDLDWINDMLVVAFRATGHSTFNPPTAASELKFKGRNPRGKKS